MSSRYTFKRYLAQKLTVVLDSRFQCGALSLEIPKQPDHGDFALTLAFKLAATLKQSPKIIAEQLSDVINQDSGLQSLVVAEPLNGFVNLKLVSEALWQHFLELQSVQIDYDPPKDKILFEYVSANPTGPLHIGHGRWAVIGSAIATLLRETQHDVKTEFYINDAGSQITKFYASVNAVKEGKPIPEDGYHGAYIKDLATLASDPLLANIEDQRQILDRLGVHFDTWFSEKSLHDSGDVERAITFLKENNLAYVSDSALWFKSEQFGDEKDRVLVKADGAYTYFAVDVAYHFYKLDRGFNRLINMFGADHHGYVARIKASVKAMLGQCYQANSFEIVIGQLVSLLRGGEPVRMSKRTGDMISLEEVVDEIGVDATRFFLVHKSADSHVEFDLDVAKAQSSDNPVFYVQYAHARMSTLLVKANQSISYSQLTSELHAAERELLVKCLTFHDVVLESAHKLSPHMLAQYAYDLAKLFHAFYEHCPILKAEASLLQQRLVIVERTRYVLKQALHLLGISAPDSM